MWAARQGNQGAVRLLLVQDDINPDKPDNHSRTPLLWASHEGHEGMNEATRGRGEVLGQAGVAEACAYTPKGVIQEPKK